jgi:hypothetical protein
MNQRFTLDGSDTLEAHLTSLCSRVVEEIHQVIPRRELEAIVLGGGYGRGEGGVLVTESGDQAYNDIEFYVFVRGNRHWLKLKHHRSLGRLQDRLTHESGGLHVEFKIDSLARLRRSTPTMYSYDLVSAHRVLWAPGPHPGSGAPTPSCFADCDPHRDPRNIPAAEATRLLFNRCTGLLLAREMLTQPRLSAEQADFIGRNLAKAQLALGDALLASVGQYHWSCLERQRRMVQLAAPESSNWLAHIRRHHTSGVEFKLHPRRGSESCAEFVLAFREISCLSQQVWLWLENRRLHDHFLTPFEYASSPACKYNGSPHWQNVIQNILAFGPASALDRLGGRSPRERLLNSLPLLLWEESPENDSRVAALLQQHLRTAGTDWHTFAEAYKAAWLKFN